MILKAYKLIAPGYDSERWELAFDQAGVDKAVSIQNAAGERDEDRDWAATVMDIEVSERLIKQIAGKLAGSKATGRKAMASRENGKKGGRPRKEKPSD
jgi:hypothetical protein